MALCYKDRTFCSAQCRTTACRRNITPEVLAAATSWSASFGFEGALMSVTDFSPECHDYVPSDE